MNKMKKKRLTKRQAIREAKKIWRLILEGIFKNKYEALLYFPEFKNYSSHCPLCEYSDQIDGEDSCSHCPLVEQTGWECSDNDNSAFDLNWQLNPKNFASVIMALKE